VTPPLSLQDLLGADRPAGPDGSYDSAEGPSVADPVALFRHLWFSRRFHRDSGLGRMFHPGRVSFREHLPTDSLHVIVHGNRLTAHVDRVSPLGVKPHRPAHYSLRRTAAHNLVGMAEDFFALVRGRQGDHRSKLDCEWLWNRAPLAPRPGDLLARETSAWSVQVEAQVTGHLDEARLRAALQSLFGHQRFDHDPLWVVACGDDGALSRARDQLQRQPAGMNEWPPLRAALARSPDGDVFMLNVNHAMSDGFDALRLLSAVATTYATGTSPQPHPAFPAVGDLPVRPASGRVSFWVARYRLLVERVSDVVSRPTQLAADGARDDHSFGFHHVCLSPDETRRVVDPERPGTSRNVLLAALHRAVGAWNTGHGVASQRIGVLVAVNLRPPEWPPDTLGNFSVTARVSTSRRHRVRATTTLKAVTAQTTRNKRTRTGIALLAGLERSGLLPLWSKQSLVVLQPLTRNRQVDAALLTNLNSIEQAPSFGDAADPTTHVWFSSPSRAPHTLCIGALTVAGQLHLVLRYPHRIFDADAARRFSDHLVTEIVAHVIT
jgi:NRPS condensation-like uncharacterized protein